MNCINLFNILVPCGRKKTDPGETGSVVYNNCFVEIAWLDCVDDPPSLIFVDKSLMMFWLNNLEPVLGTIIYWY